MIVIVDYGMGNLHSILNQFERMEIPAMISAHSEDIASAPKLILPGVGFFASGIENLKNSGLIPVLEQKVLGEKTPILGICLGMQLLTKWSEEGNAQGLGWVDAETRKFKVEGADNLRIPHTGWNSLSPKKESLLFAGLSADAVFYFVHSYYVSCADNNDVAATTHYGHDFVSVLQKGNIYGTQFHPEKSHHNGLSLLRNFAERA